MSVGNIDNRYVPRARDQDIEAFIGRSDPHKPVLLVEGARQTGKTRLVQHALARRSGAAALNLERDALWRSRIDACRQFSEFGELLQDELGFSGTDGGLLFIDEAQESLHLGGFVRFMKEEWPHATVILTGSTMTRLFRPETRYPVGRVERLIVRPFAFTEFLRAHDQEHLAQLLNDGDLGAISPSRHDRLLGWFDRSLQVGGLPEVVLADARGDDFRRRQARIAADYEQDFIRVFGEELLPLVQAALRAVADFVGSPFKKTSVVAQPGTRTNQLIGEVLSRLESWHMVLRSDQRGPSAHGSHAYLPKRYLFDSGLLRHLREAAVPAIGLLERAPHLRTSLGAVIENHVATAIVERDGALTGWKRASAGGEIDFVMRSEDGSATPVECKASRRHDRRHLRGLRAWLDDHPAQVGVLVSLAPFEVTRYAYDKRVVWLPAYAAELLQRWETIELGVIRSLASQRTEAEMGDATYDVVVIGSGPGGYVCAIRAAQLGLATAIVEKDPTFGGTCLNVGCIPSKALLESSELFHRAGKEFKRHGIVVSPELDLPAMMKRKDRIVGQLTRGVAGLLDKNDVATYRGVGRLRVPGQVEVIGDDGELVATLAAGATVIATGSKVATLPGIEIDGQRVVSSTEALSFDAPPEHLAVVGAGVIGLEMGSVWARLGSKVTVLEYLDRVLPGADAEIAKAAQKSFRKLGLKFELGVRVQGVEPGKDGGVTVRYIGETEKNLDATVCLLAVGRKPNTDGLLAGDLGIELDDRGRIAVDSHLRTTAPGVWAIGDVVAGPMLAHKAEDEGVAVAERLAGLPGHVNYDAIPAVVYTHPEVAWVGRTEEQLDKEGVEYTVGRFPFIANGRAKAMEGTDGFVKLLADKTTDRLLGAHVLGPLAGELIGELTLAIELGAAAEDVARTCHAHPSLTEVVREAALDAGGRVIHI